MFDKRLWKNLDPIFLLFFFLLLACSLVVMSSASMNLVDGDPYYYVKKHAIWMGLGLVIATLLTTFNYRNLTKWCKPLYGIMLVLLVGVLFMPAQQGAHRWFNLGFIDFQPSELGKLITIVFFAAFLVSRQDSIKTWKTFFLCFLVVGIPMGLVLIEPDLGTSMVFFAILLAMMWVAGIPRKRMLLLIGILVAIVAFVFWDLYVSTDGFNQVAETLVVPLPMQAYQLMRLVIFINPYMDPLNSGYHIIQSQIAIGSGGLFGKGYGQGTQIQNDFLPEHHTDFIFSVVGEEFGLVGCLLLLLIFAVILYRCLTIAFNAGDLFGTLIVTGITMMLTFQIFVNIGMTIGIMPVTGITLPFMSYGGTSMQINMIAIGLILSVNIRSKQHIFI